MERKTDQKNEGKHKRKKLARHNPNGQTERKCETGKRKMENGQEAGSILEDCGLEDIGFTGAWFTWEKGRTVSNTIKEQLDRGVATETWRDQFPLVEVKHLLSHISDHYPIVAIMDGRKSTQQRIKRKKFRFGAMWVQEPECKKLVEDVWSDGTMAVLTEKVTYVEASLSMWHARKFKGMRCRINELKGKFHELRTQSINDSLLEAERCMKEELNELMENRNYFGCKDQELIG
ncbi:uncharacterized protein LOC111306504 [Durio zibethinus]|uniref:Uncharacterized protein LOC111306504 n=1 Tax=Durio zibethinus TaxID=66656 RepID=A0A6P6A532_DURZI|nr:uncharacterized protein LOC111306504 [Durio zibethinus]